MILAFADRAWEDYQYWATKDRVMLKRVNAVIDAALRDPYEGIGKPEQLRNNLAGYWSRRISEEHRLVYRIADEKYLVIVQTRGQY